MLQSTCAMGEETFNMDFNKQILCQNQTSHVFITMPNPALPGCQWTILYYRLYLKTNQPKQPSFPLHTEHEQEEFVCVCRISIKTNVFFSPSDWFQIKSTAFQHSTS